jgi:hypothetical protein
MPEPSFIPQILLVWAIPFVAYFTGIFIRKVALPGKDSPPLKRQVLLGIPVALIGVSPMITILHEALSNNINAYLVTLGIIIEHGMLVQETITKHLGGILRAPSAVN